MSTMDHVDHIGIAVGDIDAAIAHYTTTFGLRVVGDEVADDPGVRLVYLDAGNTMIQLVSPVRESAVAAWLAAHGDGLHHLCFRVPDIPETLTDVGDPMAKLFMGGRGRRACFLTGAHHGVNIELTEQQPARPLEVVLDDDPTGSQCAQDVVVALDLSPATLAPLVHAGKPFFAVTNIRALSAGEAEAVLRQVKGVLDEAAAPLRRPVSLIVRGDSTLRGHLAIEVNELADPTGVVVLVPAFPAASRITAGGVHHVRVDGSWLNAADTEFAQDHEFGYTERDLADYVRSRLPGRLVLTCGPDRLAAVLAQAPDLAVVIPDVVHDDDILAVARAVRVAQTQRAVLVRTASPLAAVLTSSLATESLLAPQVRAGARPDTTGGLLIVCGSHTATATRQLDHVTSSERPAVELDTDVVLSGSAGAAIDAAVRRVRADLAGHGIAVLSTRRTRRHHHQDLASGARLMAALTETVGVVRGDVGAVIIKGGISSIEVTRDGLGVATVTVVGQLETGISLWRLNDPPSDLHGDLPVVSVPGNVGDDGVLARLARQLGYGHTLSRAGAEHWKDAVS